MPSIILSPRIHSRLACAAALLLVTACQVDETKKFKWSNGRFPEWETYESKHFYPADGIVTAVDTKAGTVTIGQGKNSKVFPVTPATRIVHEGTDIPLAQLPLKEPVKFRVSADGQQLLSIWFGKRLYTYHRPGAAGGTSVQQQAPL